MGHGALLDRAVGLEMGRPGQILVVIVGSVGGRILEVPVRVVFNDYNIEFYADGIYFFAALNAQCSTRGVLANARLNVSSKVNIL